MPEEKRYQVNSCRGFSADLPWDTAEVLAEFCFPWEKEREPPPTEFRALWDEEQFHFRFDCMDEDIVLAPGADAKEKVIGSDRAEIFMAPTKALDPYYCLEIDPRGEVLDYEARYHRRINWDWSCPGLVVRTDVQETAYQVQGSIPLETLRQLEILGSGSNEFLAGVFRAEFSREADDPNLVREGWMAWVDPQTGVPDFHIPGTFGVFELIG